MFSINLCIILLVTFLNGVNSEVFSSISAMEHLVTTQGKVLDLFDVYLQKHEEYMKQVKKLVGGFRLEHQTAEMDPGKYVSNPINSFKIIKQLHKDWNGTLSTMYKALVEFDNGLKNLRSTEVFPETEDFTGSMEALIRLQTVYLLETEDVTRGILRGVKHSTPLNSNDCFEIGMVYYNMGSHNAAHEWFLKSLDIFDADYFMFDNLSLLKEYIAYNEYRRGNIHVALQLCKEMYLSEPNHTRLPTYIQDFENIIKNKTAMAEIIPITKDPHIGVEYVGYEELCREDLDRPESLKKNLKCRYVTTSKLFSKISPFKVEEHSHRPYVAVFHDIIYDSEIAYLKNEVRSKFRRARVIGENSEEVVKFRISVNAWLKNNHSKIIERINTRMEDMTGLNLEYAEEPQLANYGIGGHYAAHYDFTQNKEKLSFSKEPKGNRLGTILIYLTDVEEGGNTVFPLLGISVKPRKATAVFWYNLHPSGEGNTGTIHAACPVLIGTKWVLNKWIRLAGNERIKPCKLSFQAEGPCSDYPKLVAVQH